MNENKLKPCPFCGRNPKLVHISQNGKDGSRIECECGVIGVWYPVSPCFASDDKAIEFWNGRASK